MRLLLAGDTHGNIHHFKYLLQVAADHSIDDIVVLGDFGYWPHVGDFHKVVDKLSEMHGVTTYWLDGNHENFNWLEKAVKMDSPFPQQMGNNLYYLPRGMLWVLDDVKILVLGGAVSIDKNWRLAQEERTGKEGSLWWPQEQINNDDINRAKSRGKVDLMFTHDMPDESYHTAFGHSGYKADEMSRHNRQKVSEVLHHAHPKALFHGHMHTDYFDHVDGTDVRGLNCDETGKRSWYIIDLIDYLDS